MVSFRGALDIQYTVWYTEQSMSSRTEILSQALELFATRGYDAVGVQQICTAAGVTKPTLYHYFGSKRGLLEALISERVRPLHQELVVATDYAGDLPANLEQVARVYFQCATREPDFYRLLLSLWFFAPASEAFQAALTHHTTQQALVEQLFERAAAQHGNMHGRQQIYARTFIGMIYTYIGLAINDFVQLDDTIVHRAVHQFSHGIYS
jgi:AcrR family transcriptional regulator